MRAIITIIAVFFFCTTSAVAGVVEPTAVKSLGQLKPNDGVLRLSVRTQRQYVDTLFLYFISVQPDGSDGDLILRFERGAGIPIMGSNQIDVKAKYYAVPPGRYRLLAYTFVCDMVPPIGTVCSYYGNALPTERYLSGSPTFTISANRLTDAGDFILEYIKDVDLTTVDLFKDRLSDDAYAIRWRPIRQPLQNAFVTMPIESLPPVSSEFHSRIECERRPKNKTVQFPFRCN
jgi:hypothetical protein